LDARVVAPHLSDQEAIEQVAGDYGVSREAVEAAIAYYWRHKPQIDARLVVNAG
jgi:uncharacterized protein (DUF433 family)